MTTIPMTRSHKRVYAAAGALELTSRALPKHQRLLIQVRASYLNQCSFCITMHTTEATKQGMSEHALALLKDTPLSGWGDLTQDAFTAEELLLLSFVDAGTALTAIPKETRDELQEKVVAHFGEKTTGDIIASIATINMWNRLGSLAQR